MTKPLTITADDAPLVLKPYPNGGWVIEAVGGGRFENKPIGCYSSIGEALDALRAALAPKKPVPMFSPISQAALDNIRQAQARLNAEAVVPAGAQT